MFARLATGLLLVVMSCSRFSVLAFTSNIPCRSSATSNFHLFQRSLSNFASSGDVTRKISSDTISSASIPNSSLAMKASKGNHNRRNYLATTGAFFGAASVFTWSRPALAEGGGVEGFESSQSGIQYKVLKEGAGGQPTPGMNVQVHYSGWLDGFGDEGRKFDSSYDRRRPFSFKVGVGQVIGGWDESVLGMKVGEKRNVIIPPELGYGARGAGGVIPPNATLYFTIELLALK